MKILIINGPNLGLLGKREVNVYGSFTLADLEKDLNRIAKDLSLDLEFFQSDIEGEIVKKIGFAWTNEKADGIIINPGAYTHTSIAIHDAIKASNLPVIEAHISHIYAREEFRHTSIISSACKGQISGFGEYSYVLGLYALKRIFDEK